MQAGVRIEGRQPSFTREDDLAIAAYNYLSDGNGGIDFGDGLENVAAKLGIDDIEGLMDRLYLIKHHKKPE